MKVLFYVNRYPAFGGIETITSTLASGFINSLHYDVAVYSYEHDERLLSNIPEGLKFYEAKKSDLENVLKEFNPDVVIFQDSYAPVELPLINLKQKYQFKLITVEHNTPDCHIVEYKLRWKSHSWHNPISAAKKMLYPYVYTKINKREGLRHASLIDASDNYVLLSDSYKQILQKYWDLSSPRITAIPNIKNNFGVRNADENHEKKNVVLFVGRLTEQKGIKYLIEIWSKIEKYTTDWQLKILGDGELKQYVIDEIKQRGLSQIDLVGFKSNIQDYYKQATVLFMTSIFEGFPLVLAEAMQFGVVPFAFDSYTAVHDIIGKDCGFLIKPFDAKQYANNFLKFISMDLEKSKLMRKNAILKSEQFSEVQIIDRWKNLIEK